MWASKLAEKPRRLLLEEEEPNDDESKDLIVPSHARHVQEARPVAPHFIPAERVPGDDADSQGRGSKLTLQMKKAEKWNGGGEEEKDETPPSRAVVVEVERITLKVSNA